MAVKKEKTLTLSGDRDLGSVTKKLSSGMFLTSKGEKIPPLPSITIGTKVKLQKSRFVIVDGEKKRVDSTEDEDKNSMDVLRQQNIDLQKRMDAMEKKYGEKGSRVQNNRTPQANDAVGATPPKVK